MTDTQLSEQARVRNHAVGGAFGGSIGGALSAALCYGSSECRNEFEDTGCE